MKLTSPVVVAFGLAMLCMLPIIDPLLEPTRETLYHLDGSTSTIFYPVLLSIFLLWIILIGVLKLASRPGRTRRILWTALIVTLPCALLQLCESLFKWALPNHLDIVILILGLVAAVAILTFWRPSFQRTFDRAQGLTATVLGFLALSGLMTLSQLGWSAWQTRAANAPVPLHHITGASVATVSTSPPTLHSRIIWLILDELSYRQVYEHRYPGLNLPAFDRLAAQSTLFTQVAPAGFMTEYVVPSLISGVPADGIHASSDLRRLSLQSPTGNTLIPFDQHQTVFQDALDRGYSTAVAGWFNPYCRILSDVLDRCFWTNHNAIKGGMSVHQTLLANLVAPLDVLWDRSLHFRKSNFSHDRTTPQMHMQDYTTLFDAADTMLDDPSANFLFLHMPVPHPIGIYNRHTGQLTTGPANYIDNLALADAYLAHLRSLLEQRGEWDSSTILIMGDHSWRTAPMWSMDAIWTGEEQKASDGGKFDDRPAYILKLPNQQQAARIDTPYSALRTRALLDALMDQRTDQRTDQRIDQQRIQSPQDLAAWVANPANAPPVNSVAANSTPH